MSAPHVPTDKQRQYVKLCVASGIPQDAIAGLMQISPPTLRQHYAAELAFGKQEMLATVAGTLFQHAVGRPARFDDKGKQLQAELKPNMTAGIFIMKAQGGWKETQVVEHVDPTAGATDRLNAAIDRILAASEPDGGSPAPEAPEATRH
mgnify:CR=1 FL=1